MKGTKPATILPGSIGTVPRAPAWLSKEAKSEWRRIMPDLVERKILTDADLGNVENYCVSMGHVRQIERMLQLAFDLKLFRAQNQAAQTARQLAAELGCTPVSRSRPTLRDDGDGDDLSFLG